MALCSTKSRTRSASGTLIEQGYLSALISKRGDAQIDTTGLHRQAGDYVASEVDAAAMVNLESNVREIVAYGQDRRAWLTFSAGVAHATAVRDEMRRYGVASEVVTGKMDDAQRDRAIRAFREGHIRHLSSVGVLTTGFNVPQVDLVALMYSTLSPVKYVQTVGRGFRLAEGKANCLVLDYGGNVRRHGPIDLVEIKPPGEGGGDAPVKECPECASYVLVALRICPDCGFEFPAPEPEEKLEREADTTPILSKAPALAQVQEVPVTGWYCERHEKEGSPDSLKVTYFAGLLSFREWWALEHRGFARDKAERLWLQHGGRQPVPSDIFEAQSRFGELTPPAVLQVRKNGKWWDILGRKFVLAATGEAA
jgi:DNA repair protein RadD